MDRTIRLVIDIDIDSESAVAKSLDAETIMKHLEIDESDTIDGYEIFPSGIDGINPTLHFVLCNGRIVSKELL